MLDVTGLVSHWGYLAIFVILLLGNVGLPIPEETALISRPLPKGFEVLWGSIKGGAVRGGIAQPPASVRS